MRAAIAEVPRQFVRFLLVGSAGFVVDGGLLLVMIDGAGLSPLAARLVSFSVAVTVTWLLNRLWTFRHHASDRRLAEWRRYVAVNGVGGMINLGIFAGLAGPVPGLGVDPLAAFAIASAVALILNFLGSRRFAFGGPGSQEARQEPPPF